MCNASNTNVMKIGRFFNLSIFCCQAPDMLCSHILNIENVEN